MAGLQIGRLDRVDSDFAPFLHHAGVPSIDLYYGKGKHILSALYCMYPERFYHISY